MRLQKKPTRCLQINPLTSQHDADSISYCAISAICNSGGSNRLLDEHDSEENIRLVVLFDNVSSRGPCSL
jgi:hypothetical protein